MAQRKAARRILGGAAAPLGALALAVAFSAAVCWTLAPAAAAPAAPAADDTAAGAAAEKRPAAKPPPRPQAKPPAAKTRPAPEPARIVPSEEIEVETPVAFPADI